VLNAHSSKTVKATDFTFDTQVSRVSPDIIPEIFLENGRGQGHVTLEIFGHKMLIAPKWLQLQTSNLTHMFLGTFRTLSLKYFFRKGGLVSVT